MHRTALSGCVVGLVLTACAPEGSGSAFVSFNVPLDSMCQASPDGEEFIPQGLFDVGQNKPDGCVRSYTVSLLVNSNLQTNFDPSVGRSEPNVLQFHSAEVKLTTINDETIEFATAADEPALPNPFLVTCNTTLFPSQAAGMATQGIASVEAIPAAYAPFLRTAFTKGGINGTIRAEIQIFGTTTGDVDVQTAPFTYPIEICNGCLTTCLQDIPEDMTVSDIVGDHCAIGGQDNRVCIENGPSPRCP